MVSVCAIETPDEELPLWTSCNTVRFSIFRSVAGRSGLGHVKLVCEASVPEAVKTTLRASLSGTFLQRKDVVNQRLEFE